MALISIFRRPMVGSKRRCRWNRRDLQLTRGGVCRGCRDRPKFGSAAGATLGEQLLDQSCRRRRRARRCPDATKLDAVVDTRWISRYQSLASKEQQNKTNSEFWDLNDGG